MLSHDLTTQRWRNASPASFKLHKRPVVGYDGVVASTHSLGSSAGAEMLAAGGNAIDAAIATLFTLAVVEPAKVGIFGAGFFNLRLADGRAIAIDNYSQAPGAASPTMFTPVANRWPHYMRVRGDQNRVGALAAGVPGALKAWCEVLDQFGTMTLADVMQPAIRYAENGFRASKHLCNLVDENAQLIRSFSETRRIFMPSGEAPRIGERIVQRDLAQTLKRIAEEGSEHLYDGELGERIVQYSQANNGILTMDDLRAYRIRQSEPVVGSYRGYEIAGPPPPAAGGVHLIELLHILEMEDIRRKGFGCTETLHFMAEAMQLAFESRNRYLGDPHFREIPTDRLLSKFHAEDQLSRILMDTAMNPLPSPAFSDTHGTSHVTCLDRSGNLAASTQTINLSFGSKSIVPGTGVMLDNTMANFDPHPHTANSIQPFKRVASSMAPVIVSKHGRPAFALGLPGGMRIWPTVAQGIINIIDHQMTPQEAVEAPRIWTQGQEVELEQGLGDDAAGALRRLGHDVQIVNKIAGSMCLVALNEDSTFTGSTCWRSDSGAVAVGGGNASPGITLSSFPIADQSPVD